MLINHLVLFQYKTDAAADAVGKAIKGMLALKDTCLHAETQKPYIKPLTGGKDNSPEGHSYAFVFEFENEEDRDYYLKKNPAHPAFADFLRPIVEKAVVVDYEF
ncbi:stress responsive A/B barrel domain-containing protein [Xylariaceae sp. FL0255]|nr:stress responsive A/B barrel domain-containing protein [Xylariaceae sp. FL0255]